MRKLHSLFIVINLLTALIGFGQQDCFFTVFASKSFPSADDKIIWSSNRPIEYFYPGEKVHVKVTGEMNYMPETKSEEKGGIFGFFTERVEWVEDHWLKPANKEPVFNNVQVNSGSIKKNPDGSYECDFEVEPNTNDPSIPIILQVKVLSEEELTGKGGNPTTGQYRFEFTVDSKERLHQVRQYIETNLSTWGNDASEKLRLLIEPDIRMKCAYSNELAISILTASQTLSRKIKQSVLQYASALAPGNHEITIELATTYSGDPGGCSKQIEALTNAGITQINVNPNDFDVINNSAKAFEILANAYFDCANDFRDELSIDTLRRFYRMASTQYGMTFNYPKQIKMAIEYANVELDNNDKDEIINAARFLEEIWATVPVSIDSVEEVERKYFFEKFGNTQHVYYEDVKDSIKIVLSQSNNPLSDLFKDQIEILHKKNADSTMIITYKYRDKYLCNFKGNDTLEEVHQTNWSFTAKLNKDYTVSTLKISKTSDDVAGISSKMEEANINNPDAIKIALPNAVRGFTKTLDIPKYCPKSTRRERYVTHDMAYFQLNYYVNEPLYSLQMEHFLPFILLSDAAVLLSINVVSPQSTKNKLIVNKETSPTFVDGFGLRWKLQEINFN